MIPPIFLISLDIIGVSSNSVDFECISIHMWQGASIKVTKNMPICRSENPQCQTKRMTRITA